MSHFVMDTDFDYIARYGFDLASNRVQLTKQTGNADPFKFDADEVTTYEYDENDRLLREQLDVQGTTDGDSTTFYEYNGTEQTQQTAYDGLHENEPGTGAVKATAYDYNVRGRLASVAIDSDGDGDFDQTFSYRYDDSGIRVSSHDSITGLTTIYHVDPNNATGFAQVLEEGADANSDGRLQAGEIARTYTFGLSIIAQQAPAIESGQTLYFLKDGHGSTRALATDASVVQSFSYDAYGSLQAGPGVTSEIAAAFTSYLYSGEQTDQTGLNYLRSRYMDPRTGRFITYDAYAGNIQDPLSLHKYLYTHANPIMGIDPSGRDELLSTLGSLAIGTSLRSISIGATVGGALSEVGYFIGTPIADWSTTGALASLASGAFGGAFGSTIIGGAYFAIQAVYQGVEVWRDPHATGLQKALASVNVLVGVASAYALRNQVRSQYLEWSEVYSRIPLGIEVQRDLTAIRRAFAAGESTITLGSITIRFSRDAPQGFLGSANSQFLNEIVLTQHAVGAADDALLQTIIHENLHLDRYSQGIGSSGFGRNLVESEEAVVDDLTQDIFTIGRQRSWW